jgi:hypothetical protein
MLMRVVGLEFAMLASGRNVTGSGSGMTKVMTKVIYLIIKSYSSVVITTKVEFY